VILTTYDAGDLVFKGIKAGAEGYLLKDADTEALVEAIHGVMRGESVIDPKVAHKVLGEFPSAWPARRPPVGQLPQANSRHCQSHSPLARKMC
jgi:DNA-binding NarL/FixJ family response regulator